MMIRALATVLLALTLWAPQAFAADRLDGREMRKVMPGNWSGTWKGSSLVLSIGADGSVKGTYNGINATGSWSVKRARDGDRICLTFSAVVSATKCGELFRRGNNSIYGYINHDKPRLYLRRS